MRTWCAAAGLALGACGRLGFDPVGALGDAAPDGSQITPDGPNGVFVTSATVVPGMLGTIAAADQMCRDAAIEAGLPGAYVAWISDATTDAIDRLGGARGWIRYDGRVVVDTQADLATGRLQYPIALDEHGMIIRGRVATGTDATGRATVDNCLAFMSTSVSDYITTGSSAITASGFTVLGQGFCFQDSHLYCFGTDRAVAVQPTPVAGRTMFVAPPWAPGGGLPSADAHCASNATTMGLAGTYRAFLATQAMSPIDRFASTRGPIVRPDGLVIATDLAALGAQDLITSIGATDATDEVWAGSRSPVLVANAGADNCNDWMATTTMLAAAIGHSTWAETGSFGFTIGNTGTYRTCNVTRPIYCLAE